MGPMKRTLRGAYLSYLAEVEPARLPIARAKVVSVPTSWLNRSKIWKWVERAAAYDAARAKAAEIAPTQALLQLREATEKAAKVLIESLESGDSKAALAAAKEILDRGGVPAVTRQEIKAGIVNIDVDDVMQAREELARWNAEQDSDANNSD